MFNARSLAWMFVAPLQYIRKQGSIIKQVKIWQNVCLILHWYPTWMATALSNRPIKMVVHIQHLQCLSKDDKDHEDNPTGWWWMFWFPSEKKTNRQGTALTDNHCMHWEHPRKEQRAERRAPIGRVRQKKNGCRFRTFAQKWSVIVRKTIFPTFKVSSVANPKQDQKIKKEVQNSSWNGLGQPHKLYRIRSWREHGLQHSFQQQWLTTKIPLDGEAQNPECSHCQNDLLGGP